MELISPNQLKTPLLLFKEGLGVVLFRWGDIRFRRPSRQRKDFAFRIIPEK
jgi:hypothetical protein